MYPRYLFIFILLLAAGISNAAINKSPDYTLKSLPQPLNKFNQVVEIFLKAVDSGELIIFDNIITRDMLQPVEVKYIYTHDNENPSISVFSFLRKPLKLPGVDDCTVGGIEVIMDIDGNIIDSSIHVSGN
jgi:hypothetical protein